MEEFDDFIENHTDAEWEIVRHLKIGHEGKAGAMKEIRRLLGESIAKCKVIPFPVGGKPRPSISKVGISWLIKN